MTKTPSRPPLLVEVATFGNGPSLLEWEALASTPWLHHMDFTVRRVAAPDAANLIALHGPFTPWNWELFGRWWAKRAAGSRVIAVGGEVRISDEGELLDPSGAPSGIKIDLVVAGHPPTPEALKQAVARVFSGGRHV